MMHFYVSTSWKVEMAYKCFNLAARNNYNGPTSNFNDTKIGRYLLVIHFRRSDELHTPRLIMVIVNWKMPLWLMQDGKIFKRFPKPR